ncbi:MAG: hypothetical protein KAV82_00110 [Phycisphaerae bacterium]|nr:hypothetical protein [Phycisphaerae bacterium]
MAQWCERWGVEAWAYCLLPNHAHLIVVPTSADGLRRAVGEAHRRYMTLYPAGQLPPGLARASPARAVRVLRA